MKYILLVFTFFILKTNIIMAQNKFRILTKKEEQANYNLRDLKFHKMSPYNEVLHILLMKTIYLFSRMCRQPNIL